MERHGRLRREGSGERVERRTSPISHYSQEIFRDVSTPLDMTKTVKLIRVIVLGTTNALFAQESPTPTYSSEASVSPSPSATASLTCNVPLRFVPPLLEGTISLGIFDSSGKLDRVLHRGGK